MREDYEIVTGDKVDIAEDDNRTCRTMIEDTIGNGLYLAGVPTRSGVPVRLQEDDTISVMFYRESGRYAADMKVVGFEKRGEVNYLWLLQTSEPHRVQRRDAYRVPSRIKVLVCDYIEQMDMQLQESVDMTALTRDTAESVDISLAGIAITTKQEYKPGEKYMLKLHIDDSKNKKAPPFTVFAEVVRTAAGNNKGTYRVGMQFFGLTKSMDEFLARYIMARQQNMLMQKKLVEQK